MRVKEYVGVRDSGAVKAAMMCEFDYISVSKNRKIQTKSTTEVSNGDFCPKRRY